MKRREGGRERERGDQNEKYIIERCAGRWLSIASRAGGEEGLPGLELLCLYIDIDLDGLYMM